MAQAIHGLDSDIAPTTQAQRSFSQSSLEGTWKVFEDPQFTLDAVEVPGQQATATSVRVPGSYRFTASFRFPKNANFAIVMSDQEFSHQIVTANGGPADVIVKTLRHQALI